MPLAQAVQALEGKETAPSRIGKRAVASTTAR